MAKKKTPPPELKADEISLPPGFKISEDGHSLEVPDTARISAVWHTSWLNVKGQRVQVKG